MRSHPAKLNPSVAINALWCVLIALALLAFPIIARQVRIQSGPTPQSATTAPASPETAMADGAAPAATHTGAPVAARP